MEVLPERIKIAVADAWKRLAAPGDWWTGVEKLELADVARCAFGERFDPPWMRPATARSVERCSLGQDVARIMVKLIADENRIDRDWAAGAVALVGEAPYVELVAIASTIADLDAWAMAIGAEPDPLPAPASGEPARLIPEDMADIGAYVPMRVPWTDANVSRALTLSPSGNEMYRSLAMALYHEGQFYDFEWDKPISRPQAEAIATAVSAAHECFY